eukprot:CAMPEP_0113703870 /NCGR_PEP_ID=MMETSP0038_2-20120614/26147_1 /TAXON_ID=2898 /ORGANISM="Cryptomonas paramecium" /LENGTH=72 /DNA_ID=CAMNT_0000628475 /DNA_START=108 /DNA_END=323 /DNA_ORIENTATION=+ /assembly_acc=CAM_ASM_000170
MGFWTDRKDKEASGMLLADELAANKPSTRRVRAKRSSWRLFFRCFEDDEAEQERKNEEPELNPEQQQRIRAW